MIAGEVARLLVAQDQLDGRGPTLRADLIGRWVQDHVDTTAFSIEHHDSFGQRKQREILALAHILAWMKTISDLTNKDIARAYLLATVTFYAPPLSVRVPAVAAGTLSLFVCHWIVSSWMAWPLVSRSKPPRGPANSSI